MWPFPERGQKLMNRFVTVSSCSPEPVLISFAYEEY